MHVRLVIPDDMVSMEVLLSNLAYNRLAPVGALGPDRVNTFGNWDIGITGNRRRADPVKVFERNMLGIYNTIIDIYKNQEEQK